MKFVLIAHDKYETIIQTWFRLGEITYWEAWRDLYNIGLREPRIYKVLRG